MKRRLTRWPLTVVLLRSQWDDLSSREYRTWLDMVIGLIRVGDFDCARRACEHFDDHLWLFAGDPT